MQIHSPLTHTASKPPHKSTTQLKISFQQNHRKNPHGTKSKSHTQNRGQQQNPQILKALIQTENPLAESKTTENKTKDMR